MSGQPRPEPQPGSRSSAERPGVPPSRRIERPSARVRPRDESEIAALEASSVAYPHDLAREVRRRLKEGNKETGPSSQVLVQLFEILAFASMRTEERVPVTCSVTYMDPDKPDPTAPRNPRPGRWSVTRLANRQPLTIANLVKLSAAADPVACSLAVHSDQTGSLYVWGMIDQALHNPGFGAREAEKAPERPGILQAIVSPAHIDVYRRTHLLASLIHGELTYRFHDVWNEGRIARTLDRYIAAFGERVRQAVGKEVYDSGEKRSEAIRRVWVNTLCRVLLAVQAYEKGGAVLLIDKPPPPPGSENAKPSYAGLNLKYELSYRRLGAALERLKTTRIKGSHARDRIWTGYLLTEESGDLPGDLYLEEGLASTEEAAYLAELEGAVRFVASLSRADGLVLIDGGLNVNGFGVEITVREEPKQIWLAGNATGTPESCRTVDFTHFGLRHRSMMRYCDRFPGSVGFVVSQDGTIRAMAKDGDRLVVWETLQLT